MKNISAKLTTLLMVLALSFNAQEFGNIVIRNASPSMPKFNVTINGIRLINEYVATASFNYLDEYQYRVKISQVGAASPISFTLASEPRYLSKYVIMKDNMGNYSVLLESKSLMMSEPENTGMSQTPTQTLVPTQTLAPKQTLEQTQSVGRNQNQVVALENNIGASKTETVASTQPANPAVVTMAKADFDDRLAAIKKVSFDKDRLNKAKNLFEGANLSTSQVCEVVKAFSFEDSKLNFAKWAYKSTVDKSNYYKVEDHLTFSSSKKDLSNYVKSQPK